MKKLTQWFLETFFWETWVGVISIVGFVVLILFLLMSVKPISESSDTVHKTDGTLRWETPLSIEESNPLVAFISRV